MTLSQKKEKAARLCCIPERGEPEEIPLPAFNAYAKELAYLCDVIEGKTENLMNTPEAAARSIYLTERIKQSADSGKPVSL